MVNISRLQNIKDTIEDMNKCHQIEILKIFLNNSSVISENSNGTFVNLSYISDTCVDLLEDYISFVNNCLFLFSIFSRISFFINIYYFSIFYYLSPFNLLDVLIIYSFFTTKLFISYLLCISRLIFINATNNLLYFYNFYFFNDFNFIISVSTYFGAFIFNQIYKI